jgi:mxaJ protein
VKDSHSHLLALAIGVVVPLAILLSPPVVRSAGTDETAPLRVCADPDNLPFSNERREGLENKIAEVIAQDLGAPLDYYWWPHQRGLVRNTLGAGKCDVLIGIPKGYDPVLWTRPYYRSAYVVAYPSGKGFHLASLDAPQLRDLKVGVHLNTPPQAALGQRGIRDNVVVYPLFYDYRSGAPERRPSRIMDDLRAGVIDVAVVWGPIAGYFGSRGGPPALELVPITDAGPVPLTFEISMGVRKDDGPLKARLEAALDRRQADIRRILADYGVPQLELQPVRPSTPGGPGAESGTPAGGHRHPRD